MTTPSLIFPTLVGADIAIKKEPIWNTIVQTAASGRETRINLWQYPLYQFSIPYEFLRSNISRTELATLIGFFNQAQGSFKPFLYTDPEENSVIAAPCIPPNGNGAITQFQLAMPYGGFNQPVYWPNGAVTMSPSSGSPVVGANGLVTYSVAPGAVPVTWTGSFYFGCRFLTDNYQITRFMVNYWSGGDLDFKGGMQDKVTT